MNDLRLCLRRQGTSCAMDHGVLKSFIGLYMAFKVFLGFRVQGIRVWGLGFSLFSSLALRPKPKTPQTQTLSNV